MLAFVGLGSNMAGDVKTVDEQLLRAAARLEESGAGTIVERSRMFATPPWGVTDQAEFRNAVIAIQTDLEPLAFLHACQAVEQSAHRVREVRWGPRTLDVDVLALFAESSSPESPEAALQPITSDGTWGEELVVPHPFAHQRGFVLVPWADLPTAAAPGVTIAGQTVNYWLGELLASNKKEVDDVTAVTSPDWDAARDSQSPAGRLG